MSFIEISDFEVDNDLNFLKNKDWPHQQNGRLTGLIILVNLNYLAMFLNLNV